MRNAFDSGCPRKNRLKTRNPRNPIQVIKGFLSLSLPRPGLVCHTIRAGFRIWSLPSRKRGSPCLINLGGNRGSVVIGALLPPRLLLLLLLLLRLVFEDLMDLATENKIAAMLLKEAQELRKRAEKEGVHVYLERPKVRGRPNSRFLTATVLGVQQANRAVEVSEMWQIRQKELELEDRFKEKSRQERCNGMKYSDVSKSSRSKNKRYSEIDNNTSTSCSASKRVFDNNLVEVEGLRDEEVEEFLHSRVKRGRGAVGSRMDETGPYLPSCPDFTENMSVGLDVREHRVVFGPEKPSLLNSDESCEEEPDITRRKKARKIHSRSSEKKHSKHTSKEKSRDKKRKRKEKKSRH